MKQTFFRVRLTHTPYHIEDVITHFAFEFGATGVSEALAYSQPDLTYDPDIIPASHHDLDVFFLEKPAQEFFDKVKELAPHVVCQIFEEENKDWLAEWKKGFEPFQLVGPYWIVPSWLEAPSAAKVPISIDPGMAFGTGTHATTKMAAYFVHKLCSTHGPAENLKTKKLLDVGTGTAILAILAYKEGVGEVVGIEIDPEARRVARENVLRNNCDEIQIPEIQLEEISEVYDYVVANIIDGVLIKLKDALLKRLKSGGEIFLTGILLEREEIFMKEFIEPSGLRILRRIEQDEWVGYWLKDEP